MARAAALSDMITAVRELADLVGAESRAPDAAIARRLNDHLAALFDLLVELDPERYAVETPSSGAGAITTSADKGRYAVPVDHCRLLRVQCTDGSRWTTLPRWSSQETAHLRQTSAARSIDAYSYRLTGNDIEILPTPQVTTHTLVVRYVPAFVPLSTAGPTTFDGVNGWERFAVLGAAIDLMQAEEADVAALMAERATMRARIEKLAGSRDAGRPPRMQDVERGDYPIGFFGGWGRGSFGD